MPDLDWEALMRSGRPTTCSIVTDGTEQNQSILTVETTGALTAEETIDAAIQRLNSKVKGFTDAVTSLQVPGTA